MEPGLIEQGLHDQNRTAQRQLTFHIVLTAFLWVTVVADENLLARRPEERRPVDRVVETQAAVVEDVDVAGADLVQRLELQRGDPALLQDQQRNAASAAEEREGKKERKYKTIKGGGRCMRMCEKWRRREGRC